MLDGVEIEHKTYTRGSLRLPNTNHNNHHDCITFGYETDRQKANPSAHFDGFMARVRMWAEYRTTANIKKYMHDDQLMNRYDGNLKLYWKMDYTENQRIIYDHSPSKLHVTIPGSNFYEWELVPDGLYICEGHSWWDGAKCRDDIWMAARWRGTSNALNFVNIDFERQNGYSISFWFFMVNAGNTS